MATEHIEGNQIIRRNSYTGSAHLVLEETVAGASYLILLRRLKNNKNLSISCIEATRAAIDNPTLPATMPRCLYSLYGNVLAFAPLKNTGTRRFFAHP